MGLSKNNNKAMSTKLAKQAVVQILNARRELKYFEAHTSGTLSSAGALYAISEGIIQGDTSGARDGESIHVQSLQLHWELNLNSSTSRAITRLIIFSDNQAQGIYPSVTGGTNGILTRADTNSSYDFPVAIHHRFKIYLDESICLSDAGVRTAHIYRNIKLGNHKVFFTGTSAAQASNGPGALYALFIEDGVTFQTAYDISAAIKYYDS
jgi:hypothetical protein